jgi:hypothetical protein
VIRKGDPVARQAYVGLAVLAAGVLLIWILALAGVVR